MAKTKTGRCRFANRLLAIALLDHCYLAAYLMAAFWGAGGSTLPLTAGTARGITLQESLIRIVAYSSAPTGIASFGLILFGLRIKSGRKVL
jgi:hypothetical protein